MREWSGACEHSFRIFIGGLRTEGPTGSLRCADRLDFRPLQGQRGRTGGRCRRGLGTGSEPSYKRRESADCPHNLFCSQAPVPFGFCRLALRSLLAKCCGPLPEPIGRSTHNDDCVADTDTGGLCPLRSRSRGDWLTGSWTRAAQTDSICSRQGAPRLFLTPCSPTEDRTVHSHRPRATAVGAFCSLRANPRCAFISSAAKIHRGEAGVPGAVGRVSPELSRASAHGGVPPVRRRVRSGCPQGAPQLWAWHPHIHSPSGNSAMAVSAIRSPLSLA